MADAKQVQFGQRLRRINRNHQRLANGYVTSVNHDGLIIARPRRREPHKKLRAVAFVIIILMAFKIFLFAQIGPAAYEQRLVALQNGSFLENIAGYAMTADPITIWAADLAVSLVK